MSQFKIGDTLRVLTASWDCPIGSTVKVVPDNTNEDYFVWKGRAEVSAVNDYSREFELVKPTKAKSSVRKLDAVSWVILGHGDRVVSTANTRDEARVIKARLGGKKEGYAIHKLVLGEEVR